MLSSRKILTILGFFIIVFQCASTLPTLDKERFANNVEVRMIINHYICFTTNYKIYSFILLKIFSISIHADNGLRSSFNLKYRILLERFLILSSRWNLNNVKTPSTPLVGNANEINIYRLIGRWSTIIHTPIPSYSCLKAIRVQYLIVCLMHCRKKISLGRTDIIMITERFGERDRWEGNKKENIKSRLI